MAEELIVQHHLHLEMYQKKKKKKKDSHILLKKSLRKVNKKPLVRDFPGGAVVKNLSPSSGDTGLSPGPGRYHMLQSN